MENRKLIAAVLCVLLLLGMAGCGARSDKATANGMADDYMAKEDAVLKAETTTALPENRKLIQTVSMSVETENLDTVLQQIDSRIAQLGGYVESSNVQNGSAYSGRRYRSANITVRIPAKDLDSFIDKVDEISNIVSSWKTVEDVTLSYVATESRMKALQAEEERLLELMGKAGTLDELLTVEKRLTEVRTELEHVTSALRVFDNQVDYATIHLNIQEVKEFTEVTEPENIWQRIGKGFTESLKGVGNFFVELFVFIIVALPYLAVIAAVVFVTVWSIRRKLRKKSKKQPKEEPKANS